METLMERIQAAMDRLKQDEPGETLDLPGIPDLTRAIHPFLGPHCGRLPTERISSGTFEMVREIIEDEDIWVDDLPHDFDRFVNVKLEAYRGKDTSVTVPTGVTEIGPGAFQNNPHIREVLLPEGVNWICPEAFAGCVNLERVTLPNSVTYIGTGAFANCYRLKQVRVDKNSPKIPIRKERIYFTREFGGSTYLDFHHTVDDLAFYCCVDLKHVELPWNIHSAYFQDCFENCFEVDIYTCSREFYEAAGHWYHGENSRPFRVLLLEE